MSEQISLDVRIDSSSPVPPFEQLRAGVLDLIARGEILAGSRIPTVRALAAQLGLAANTVAKAYRELEAEGVIETRGRHGSFIKAQADSARQRAGALAVQFVAQARDLGLDDATIRELLDKAL